MSSELQPDFKTVTSRGGCLDGLVMFLTLQRLGVETKITDPEPITPTRFGLDENGKPIVVMEKSSATLRAIQTGQTVMVNNFEEVNRPKYSRRLVRNRMNSNP